MTDSLRHRVLARDRLRNSPREMEVTSRDVTTTVICLKCRWVPQERKVGKVYARCPWCRGPLHSVTW